MFIYSNSQESLFTAIGQIPEFLLNFPCLILELVINCDQVQYAFFCIAYIFPLMSAFHAFLLHKNSPPPQTHRHNIEFIEIPPRVSPLI